MKMHFNFKNGFCYSIALVLTCLMGEVNAQGFQKIFPNIYTAGYKVSEGLNGNVFIQSDRPDPLTVVGSTVVAPNGDLISHSTPFTKCYPPNAPFLGPHSVSSFTATDISADNSISLFSTEAGPQCINPPAITAIGSFSFPASENIGLNSIAWDDENPSYFIGGLRGVTNFPHFEKQIWVVKMDDQGNELWRYESEIFSSSSPYLSGLSLSETTTDGGVIYLYSQLSIGIPEMGKIDGLGQSVFSSVPGGPLTLLKEVREHPNGNTLLRKFTASSSGPGDSPGLDIYSPTGDIVKKVFPSTILSSNLNTGLVYLLSLDAIEILDNGSIVCAGTNTGLAGPRGFYLFQIDPQGEEEWFQFYPGDTPLAVDITQTDSGDLLLTGELDGNLWLMKTNAEGNTTTTCTNPFVNPGFENGLQGWTSGGNVTISSDAYSGIQAAELCDGFGTTTQVFPTIPGTQYRASFWGKVSGHGSIDDFSYGELRFLDASYVPIPSNSSLNKNRGGVSSSRYDLAEMYNTAPADAAYVQVLVVSNTPDCTTIDEFELCEGISPPATFVEIFCASTVWPVVETDPGATGADVTWNGPGATTNCTGGSDFTQISGPPKGSFFPIGETEVCYEATTSCGDSDDCCFIVTVEGNIPPPDLPDLIISSANISPNPAQQGEDLVYDLVVSNIGSAAVQDVVSIQILFDSNQLGIKTGVSLDIPAGGTQNISFDLGQFPVVGCFEITLNLDVFDVVEEENELNNRYSLPLQYGVPTCGGGGDIDLELSLNQSNPDPDQWSIYSVTATLNNTGSETATGVEISFPRPDGVVYTGGNEYVASQGSFTPNNTEVWIVGAIPAGGSATLQVNYFLRESQAPTAYAQVSAANETDVDSSPGNGTCCTPVEDDEASTASGPDPCAQFTCSNPFYELNESCPGSPIAFAIMPTAGGGSGNYTYTWSDGQTGTMATNLDIGMYSVTVLDVDLGCSCVRSIEIPNYAIIFEVDLEVVQNASSSTAMDGIVEANVSQGAGFIPYTYSWSDGTSYQSNSTTEQLTGLAPGNYSVTVTSSAFSCENTAEVNLPADGSGAIDLSLTLSVDSVDPPIYSITTLTLTVSNSGPQTATGITIDFPRPDGTVYTGGDEYSASQGSFSPNGSEVWTVGDLGAGEMAMLSVNYFTLTADPLETYAQVLTANETDGDSTPGNGACCAAVEDDEVGLTLNGTTNSPLSRMEKEGQRFGHPVLIKTLYPNPATVDKVNIGLTSKASGTFDLKAYDIYGRLIISKKVRLDKDWNSIELEITDLKSGHYWISIGEEGRRGVPLRLVVVE